MEVNGHKNLFPYNIASTDGYENSTLESTDMDKKGQLYKIVLAQLLLLHCIPGSPSDIIN